MVSRLLKVSALMLCVLASACVTFPTQGYNKAAKGNPHTVAIAPIGVPEKPNVQIMAPVGANFGLIGAMVEAGRASAAAEEARVVLEKADLNYHTYLAARIADSMREAGFEVHPIAGERADSFRGKFLVDVPSEGASEATLDLYTRFLGFVAAGASTDYRPAVNLDARLVRTADKKVLFADQIYYNNFAAKIWKTAVTIEPDASCTFKDRDALQADPPRTAKCLQDAMDAVAGMLAKQFK